MSDHYDVIVVGIGGVGSAALQELAQRGVKVLGIDQWHPGHDHGSSHGDSRAIRLVYFEHPDYVPLLHRAYTLWQELEYQSERELFVKTGILQAGPGSGEIMQGLIRAARSHNLEIEQLTPDQANSRFPGFHIDESQSAIFDPAGGLLRIDDCISVQVQIAMASGADFIKAEVHGWHGGPTGVSIESSAGKFSAGQLIITPGPWAPHLLPEFAPALHLLRKSVFWFDDDRHEYSMDALTPVFLFENSPGQIYYGFPSLDNKGVKIANHAGGIALTEPAQLDRHIDTDELGEACLFLRKHLPKLGHQLNHHTTCIYTMSEDGHFLVGKHPGHDNVSMAIGLSGHGYKFASVLGEILTDLALNGTTPLPIEFLSPARLYQ